MDPERALIHPKQTDGGHLRGPLWASVFAAAQVEKLIFEENVSLKSFSNYRIGGEARYFFIAESTEELKKAIARAEKENLSIFVLGGGTNLLISDAGFKGLVLKPEITFLKVTEGNIVSGAGVPMGKLLEFAAENNLSGLEWAGGLPGTLGGAIRGNAGAFGGEIKDNLFSVKSLRLNNGKIIERSKSECEFGYRTSIFKNEAKEVILSAVLLMKPGEKEKIFSVAMERIEYRKARQPLNYPNIGSIFKNVPLEKFKNRLTKELKTHVKNDPFPLVPAAVLISQAGLKGKKIGGAQVSERHANFIVNTGDARAEDVSALMDLIKKAVSDKFDVTLEAEIESIGQ